MKWGPYSVFFAKDGFREETIAADNPATSEIPPAPLLPEPPVTPESRFARRLIAERRARDARLGGHHFGEPAWDMLLDMFAAHDERKTLVVSSICLASAVPPSTALRCLSRLVVDGLVVRISDPADRRRIVVELTPSARNEMRRLLQSWMAEQD